MWRSRKECRDQVNVGASEATLGDEEVKKSQDAVLEESRIVSPDRVM